MSVLGRNAVWGSTLSTYRPTMTPSTGGQTNTSWGSPILSAVKWELHTLTVETLRQVFGSETDIELVSFAEAGANVLPKDGVVVNAGTYTGTKYRVTKVRRSRRYLEIALKATTEAIP